MCGIVGIYLKKKKLHNQLGTYLSEMLKNMSSRGPDSAGFAIYKNTNKFNLFKYSLFIPSNHQTKQIKTHLRAKYQDIEIKTISDHLIVSTSTSPKKFNDYMAQKVTGEPKGMIKPAE